jgi:peptidoglycan/LPS O-acetylase OafA/YrhL
MGATLALIPRNTLSLRVALATAALGLAGYVVLAACDVSGHPAPDSWRSLAYGASFAVLIFGLLRAEDRGCVFGGAWSLQLLGAASYTLYLVHFPLINVLCKVAVAFGLSGHAGAAIAFFTIFAAVMIVALGFHLRVEKPVLRYLSSLRLGAAPQAVAQQS